MADNTPSSTISSSTSSTTSTMVTTTTDTTIALTLENACAVDPLSELCKEAARLQDARPENWFQCFARYTAGPESVYSLWDDAEEIPFPERDRWLIETAADNCRRLGFDEDNPDSPSGPYVPTTTTTVVIVADVCESIAVFPIPVDCAYAPQWGFPDRCDLTGRRLALRKADQNKDGFIDIRESGFLEMHWCN